MPLTNDPTEADLLRAICADPKDDAPRWVIADWYDEHGHSERAEFIRVQLRMARMDRWRTDYCDVCGNPTNEEGFIEHGRGCYVLDADGGGMEYIGESDAYTALEKRAVDLLSMNDHQTRWVDWTGAAFKWIDGAAHEHLRVPNFERGFISLLRAKHNWWQDNGIEAMKAQPIQRVHLLTLPMVKSMALVRESPIEWENQWPTIEFTWETESISQDLPRLRTPPLVQTPRPSAQQELLEQLGRLGIPMPDDVPEDAFMTTLLGVTTGLNAVGARIVVEGANGGSKEESHGVA